MWVRPRSPPKASQQLPIKIKARLSLFPASWKALCHLAWVTPPHTHFAPTILWPQDATSGPLHLWFSQSGLFIHHERSAGCRLSPRSLLNATSAQWKRHFYPQCPHPSLYLFSCVILSWQKLPFCIILFHYLFTYSLSQQLDFKWGFTCWSSPLGSMPGTYTRQRNICGINDWISIYYVYIFAKNKNKKMT